MTEKEFLRELNQFYHLLKKENQALIKDDGETLLSIVEQKESMVPIFEVYEEPIKEKVQERLLAIRALQEENLLLTNQALSYQKMFMDTIQQQLKKNNTVYAPNNQPYQATEATIINQDM